MNSVREIVKKLYESNEPSKGIFWFVRESEDEDFEILFLDVPNDENFVGNSKNGLTYTHEKTWKDIAVGQPSSIKNRPWNHFPRGRVDIRNNKATVYLNPNIANDYALEKIMDAFSLYRIEVKMVPDGSEHYKCYLDK